MPQNYDPTTGLYHADPMWQRYQPKPAQPPDPNEMVDPRARAAGTLSDYGGAALDTLKNLALMRIPGRGYQSGTDVDMPTPPESPFQEATQGRGAPAISPFSSHPSLQGEPTSYVGPDADINKRADAIIRGSKPAGAFDTTPAPVKGLESAGPTGAKPVGFTFGPESAKPAPMPSAQEALSTLTGGDAGQLGPHRMSPDLEAFQQLLNANRSGLPAQQANILEQAARSSIADSAAKSASLEDFRDKTRKESLEEEKLRQPVEMAKYQMEGVPARQTAQEQFAKEQQERQFQQQQDLLQQNPMLQFLQGGGDPRQIHSFNKSGITFESPQKTPAGLETQATSVAQNLARAGTNTLYGYGGPTKELQAANQSAMDRLNYLNLDPKVVSYVQQAISSHPQGIATPFEEAFAFKTPELQAQYEPILRQVWSHLLASRGQ